MELVDVIAGEFGHQSKDEWGDASQSTIDKGLGVRSPLRMRLAEDNLVNQKVAGPILERMGYRAEVAANGLEVLEALKRQTYDVVFMDGCTHAGNGWVGVLSQVGSGAAASDHSHDRECDARRPREVPG